MRCTRFAVALVLVGAACGGVGDDATADALAASEDALAASQVALAEAEAALAEAEAVLDEVLGDADDGEGGDADANATAGIRIGSYEAASINRGNTWGAEVVVTIIDGAGNPVAAVDIEGVWDEGDIESDACITSDEGTCTLKSDSIRKNISWIGLELTSVVHAELPFLQGDEDIPEGMEISIRKP